MHLKPSCCFAAAFLCLLPFGPATRAQVASAPNMALRVYVKPDRLVALPDGRRMNIRCSGSGSPTVILEAGLDGSGSLAWSRVQSAIAETTRVCSYDRAGIMFSDPGPFPRTNARIVADLHELLGAAGERGPFLLVGHSQGGVYVRAYALRYPRDTAGIVLVDGSVEGQLLAFGSKGADMRVSNENGLKQCLGLAENDQVKVGGPCLNPKPSVIPDELWSVMEANYNRPIIYRTMLSELQAFYALPPLAPAPTPALGAAPLRVLYVSHPELGRDADDAWAGLMKRVATLSTRASVQLVPDSGHYIQRDQPAVVVGAVRSMVEEIRSHQQ
jgi:pimeloyl-ACP methyl ester carboxylesterase